MNLCGVLAWRDTATTSTTVLIGRSTTALNFCIYSREKCKPDLTAVYESASQLRHHWPEPFPGSILDTRALSIVKVSKHNRETRKPIGERTKRVEMNPVASLRVKT